MSIQLFLPFITTVVMLVFTVSVLKRYFATRQLQNLFWGIGLAMFAIGSFAEAYLALAWNKWVFFSWYLFGAILTAAWIGQGTLYLMVRKKWREKVTWVLLAGSLAAAYLLLQTMPELDLEVFSTDVAISEQYRTKEIKEGSEIPTEAKTTTVVNRDGQEVTAVRGLLPFDAPIRTTTPLFNIYGTLTLVGGAIYSAFLFWRKRVMPNRVIGNMLIAFGAILIASASSITRLGYGQFLYIGELLAGVIMFAGFRITARPQVGEAPSAAE
ncbi:MAG: hypothetical protein OEZ02_02690 [Anaerolineae bacterium]|nr:hypothetical protein [Anaerolineae bacterium]